MLHNPKGGSNPRRVPVGGFFKCSCIGLKVWGIYPIGVHTVDGQNPALPIIRNIP